MSLSTIVLIFSVEAHPHSLLSTKMNVHTPLGGDVSVISSCDLIFLLINLVLYFHPSLISMRDNEDASPTVSKNILNTC